MKPRPLPVSFAALTAGCLFSLSLGLTPGARAQDIPDDLLEDEHVREEFGVNSFTAPSIRKIFSDLETLRPLPYDKLKRPVPKNPPRDRSQLALTLGGLIADGFLIVESEKLLDLEEIGRALWKHAQVLGAGTRLSRHTKSLIENSALGEWDELKGELAKTQKDVEAEMVLLRDVDVAHLISLGGWMRAFEIGCIASLERYSPDKARILGRVDVAEYFYESMQTLEPSLQETKHIQELTRKLEELRDLLDVPQTKAFSVAEVEQLRDKIGEMIAIADPSRGLAAKPQPATPDEENVAATAGH